MKKIVLLLSSVMLFPFVSCQKQDTTTTIYGTVIDAYTGEGLPYVQVNFGEGYLTPNPNSYVGYYLYDWQSYASAVTGLDGHFEMNISQIEKYSNESRVKFVLRAKKYGYYEYLEERNVVLGQGNKYQTDIRLVP